MFKSILLVLLFSIIPELFAQVESGSITRPQVRTAIYYGDHFSYKSKERSSTDEYALISDREGYTLGIEGEMDFIIKGITFSWFMELGSGELQTQYVALQGLTPENVDTMMAFYDIGFMGRFYLLRRSVFDIFGGAGVQAGYRGLDFRDNTVQYPDPGLIHEDSFFATAVNFEAGVEVVGSRWGIRLSVRRSNTRTSSIRALENKKLNFNRTSAMLSIIFVGQRK